MVIHEKFAYGHIPRTGGNAVHGYFGIFKKALHLKVDQINQHIKHASFAQRGIDNGRLLLLTCRRLPNWYISWLKMTVEGGLAHPGGAKKWSKANIDDILDPDSPFGPDRFVEFPEQPLATCADGYIRQFTDDGRLRIDKWLQSDCFLLERVKAFVSDYTDVTEQQAGQMEAMRRDTIGSPGFYDQNVFHHFTPQQIAILYANNPLWAAAEKATFGHLIEWDHDRFGPPPEARPRWWDG
jgi:hypothetical protein